MTLHTLVDVEALVIGFLKTQTDVAALVHGEVSQQLPAVTKRPRVRVFRIPGPGVGYPAHLDQPRLQVEAWADDRDLANDVARTVQAALLYQCPGKYTSGVTGVVTAVREILSPHWLPDIAETPATPRYVSVIAVSVHPL